MPLYEVMEGATYTIGDKVYNPGETVDLTEGQAAPWLDMLIKEAKPAKATKATKEAEVKTNVS